MIDVLIGFGVGLFFGSLIGWGIGIICAYKEDMMIEDYPEDQPEDGLFEKLMGKIKKGRN